MNCEGLCYLKFEKKLGDAKIKKFDKKLEEENVKYYKYTAQDKWFDSLTDIQVLQTVVNVAALGDKFNIEKTKIFKSDLFSIIKSNSLSVVYVLLYADTK